MATVKLMPEPKIQFFGTPNTGGAVSPLAGGMLYAYVPGTVTLKPTYIDSTGTTQNTNPVILDASGRASIWLSGVYDMKLTDASGITIWTQSNVSSIGDAGAVYFSSSFSSLQDAVTQIGSNNATLYIETSLPAGNIGLTTVPANITIVGRAAGEIVTSGAYIVFNGGLEVQIQSFFTGTGVIEFNSYLKALVDKIFASTVTITSEKPTEADLFATGVAADVSGNPVHLLSADYTSNVANATSLKTCYWGGTGKLTTTDGRTRAPWFSTIYSAPAVLGDEDSPELLFSGDFSRTPFAVEHRITGTDTMGNFTTGWHPCPETVPHYTYLYSEAGSQYSTNSAEGRTAQIAYKTKVYSTGQGDIMCYHGNAFANGTKPNSTHFLANPAVNLFSGQCDSGADGVYLNPYETYLKDNGFDSACFGIVLNCERTVDTGAKSAVWGGVKVSSVGTKAMNNVFSFYGKANAGLDLAINGADFGTTKCAISLKANDRIYFNNQSTAVGNIQEDTWCTTTFNLDYIEYDSASSSIITVVNNIPVVQVSTLGMTLAGAAGLSFGSNGILRFSGGASYGVGGNSVSFTSSNKPGSTSGSGPSQWLLVTLGGGNYYIPCWAA